MIESDEWVWKPRRSVGPIDFGSRVSDIKLKVVRLPEEEDAVVGWDVYTIEGHDVRIYAEAGVVTSITCNDSCVYMGTEIIGLPWMEVVDLLGPPDPDGGDSIAMGDGRSQTVFEYDELGLQAWFTEDKLVAVSLDDGC